MLPKLPNIRIAVIFALAEEYKLFQKRLKGEIVERIHLDDITVDVFKPVKQDEAIGVVCVNKMGNVASGIAAARLLETFDLDLVVNIGIAAGTRKDDQNLGDVIIADKIRYYEFGKRKENKVDLAPDYSDLRSDFLKSILESDYSTWNIGKSVGGLPRRVHVGTVASGEKVIADEQFVGQLIEQDRKTVGIEMESYGIASAVFGRSEKFLMIRGICDFANSAKDDSARSNAMDGATRFFEQVLNHRLLDAKRARTKSFPDNFDITLSKTEDVYGTRNLYISLDRKKTISDFHYRKSVIQKMDTKFNNGTLRVFCVSLQVDIDNLPGNTKIEKIASLIEHCERQLGLSVEDIEQLVDS